MIRIKVRIRLGRDCLDSTRFRFLESDFSHDGPTYLRNSIKFKVRVRMRVRVWVRTSLRDSVSVWVLG